MLRQFLQRRSPLFFRQRHSRLKHHSLIEVFAPYTRLERTSVDGHERNRPGDQSLLRLNPLAQGSHCRQGCDGLMLE